MVRSNDKVLHFVFHWQGKNSLKCLQHLHELKTSFPRVFNGKSVVGVLPDRWWPVNWQDIPALSKDVDEMHKVAAAERSSVYVVDGNWDDGYEITLGFGNMPLLTGDIRWQLLQKDDFFGEFANYYKMFLRQSLPLFSFLRYESYDIRRFMQLGFPCQGLIGLEAVNWYDYRFSAIFEPIKRRIPVNVEWINGRPYYLLMLRSDLATPNFSDKIKRFYYKRVIGSKYHASVVDGGANELAHMLGILKPGPAKVVLIK